MGLWIGYCLSFVRKTHKSVHRDGVKTCRAAYVICDQSLRYKTSHFEGKDNRTCDSIQGTRVGYRLGPSYNTM